MMTPRRTWSSVLVTVALLLTLAGCTADCGPCNDARNGGPDIVRLEAFELCLSEVPNAPTDLRACTLVNIEFVVVDTPSN